MDANIHATVIATIVSIPAAEVQKETDGGVIFMLEAGMDPSGNGMGTPFSSKYNCPSFTFLEGSTG